MSPMVFFLPVNRARDLHLLHSGCRTQKLFDRSYAAQRRSEWNSAAGLLHKRDAFQGLLSNKAQSSSQAADQRYFASFAVGTLFSS